MKSLQTYLWVTVGQTCWKTRGLKKKQQDAIVAGEYNEQDKDARNFTQFLNNWDKIVKRIT